MKIAVRQNKSSRNFNWGGRAKDFNLRMSTTSYILITIVRSPKWDVCIFLKQVQKRHSHKNWTKCYWKKWRNNKQQQFKAIMFYQYIYVFVSNWNGEVNLIAMTGQLARNCVSSDRRSQWNLKKTSY